MKKLKDTILNEKLYPSKYGGTTGKVMIIYLLSLKSGTMMKKMWKMEKEFPDFMGGNFIKAK